MSQSVTTRIRAASAGVKVRSISHATPSVNAARTPNSTWLLFSLFKSGEPGDSMYVVIEGRLSASVSNEERKVQLNELSRGDVIGEVALSSGVRSADVETLSNVRLLRLDRTDLARLGRRYPRIALCIQANFNFLVAFIIDEEFVACR